MNDRDKTDVRSTSGVFYFIFFHLCCFIYLFLGPPVTGGGREKEKDGKPVKAFSFCVSKHV
jgi:hypothetical protein